MSRLIVLITLFITTFCWAKDIDETIDFNLLNNLEQLSKKSEAKKKTTNLLRFKHVKRKYGPVKFTAVLKKGASFQSLDGSKVFVNEKAIILKAEEVTAGGNFCFLLDKEGRAVYVSYSKDLQKLDRMVTFSSEKITTLRNKYKFSLIDQDTEILLNVLASAGTHSFNLYENAPDLTSTGVTLEGGLHKESSFPFFVIANYEQIINEDISWTKLNIGMKALMPWKISKTISLALFISGERSIYGGATLTDGDTFSLKETKYSLGTQAQWKSYILSLELARERIIFPQDLDLKDKGISNTDTYHSSLIFKIGKQFGIKI